MKPTFRTGGAPDLDFVTSGIVAAGDGLVEFLVSGLVPGMSTERLLQAAVLDAGSPLNVSNAIIAEIGGRPSGLALAYPIEQFGITSDLMALIPRKRLDHLQALFANPVENSFYLHALWVDPSARGMRVGRGLLDETVAAAAERELDIVSLHVWADNEAALSLYEGYGFETVATVPVGKTEQIDHDRGMLLMRYGA